MSDTTAKEVWDTLSKIDVDTHKKQLPKTTKRPAVDYLPWSKAWLLCKREFPATTYEHTEDLIHKADSIEVEVMVFIRKDFGDQPMVTMAKLAVMDARFNAILTPDARDINDSRQRCLVKALAFSGLGLNLWSDSVIPVGKLEEPISTKQLGILQGLIDETGTDLDMFEEWCECKLEELPLDRYESARGLLTAKKNA